MDEIEARVRCLELAWGICKPSASYDIGAVVETASALYSFVQTSPSESNPAAQADKQTRGKRISKEADILS